VSKQQAQTASPNSKPKQQAQSLMEGKP